MRRSLRAIACTLMLVLLIGHSAGVQVLAWAGMLVSRTAEQGFSAAVDSTFSGKSPCSLCKVSQALAEREQQGTPDDQPNPLSVKKPHLRAADEPVIVLPTAPVVVLSHPAAAVFHAIIARAPEPPPPRRA